MNRVCVLGSGTMGRGIAQIFAANGLDVVLYVIRDDNVNRGLDSIRKTLSKSVEKGKLKQADADATISKITATKNLELSADCDLAIEAAVENMSIKKELFNKIDAICKPETIFASNTSSLSITEIASATHRPGQFLGMHFFNPAPVMKLVELIKGAATTQETCDKIRDLAVRIGKDPVEVGEASGFVVNRILIPMINESIGVLADNIASAVNIDKAIVLAAHHPMGPLTLSDFIGNDVVLAIMEALFRETRDPKYRPHPLLIKYVRAGYLGKKAGKGFFDYQ